MEKKVELGTNSPDFYHNAIYSIIGKEKIVLRFSRVIDEEVSSETNFSEVHIKPSMLEGLIAILLKDAAIYNSKYNADLLKLSKITEKNLNKSTPATKAIPDTKEPNK